MSIIFRVGQMIMLVMMTLWLLFGFGISWVAWKAKSDLGPTSGASSNYSSSDSASSDTSGSGESARERRRRSIEDIIGDMDNERARRRENVDIDPGSAQPMVNPDPAHRY
jgi:hypothetical protein